MIPRLPHTPTRARTLVAAIIALLAAVATAPAFATTYYVDGASSSASDSNPGTSSSPYKTIQAAVTAHGTAGNTIVVKPFTYREQVTITASGSSSSSMVTVQGSSSSGVIVSGADDFSGTSKWKVSSGNVYVASAVTWAPQQVFLDGARLTPSTAAPSSLPSNSFVYVSGSGLYVNIGGGNPGSHKVDVGHRAYGFKVSGAYVDIDQFDVRHGETRDVSVTGGHVTVESCKISFSAHQGIVFESATSGLIYKNVSHDNGDHGIYVNGAGSTRVRKNESYANARPDTRAANGIDVNNSPSCTVEQNLCHDNQDSGIQYYNASNNCVSRNNRSWNNGDHGYDHLTSTGVMHINDLAYHNFKDGFSIEGNSPNCSVFNCIATDNGLTTGEYDLWVDSASSSGFVSDYNIFWNSTAQNPIKYITQYSTIAAYSAASGQDGHSTQADPRYAAAASGDFHPTTGSPAIDCANASVSNWPSTDADGGSRKDDPFTANTGLGSSAYSDRGPLEYVPPADRAPVVTAPSTATVNEGSQVTINITAADPDGQAITSLTANLANLPAGSNALFTPNGSNTAGTLTWTPTSNDGRSTSYKVTFTATNALSGSATTAITVSDVPGDRAPIVTAPATATVSESAQLTVNVTASDPDGQAIASLTADLRNLPAGNNAVFTPNGTNTAGTLTWTPTANDGGGAPYNVTFTATNALSGSASTAITVNDGTSTSGGGTNLVSNPGFETDLSGWEKNGSATLTRVSGGHSGGRACQVAITSSGSGISDNPPIVPSTPAAGTTYHLTAWVRSASNTGGAKLKVREFVGSTQQGSSAYSNAVTLSPTWQLVTLDYVTRTAGSSLDIDINDYSVASSETYQVDDVAVVQQGGTTTDHPPVVTAPAAATVSEGVQVTVNVTAADPDAGQAIASLTADLSALPAGSNAVFTPNGSKTAGTLTWTPTSSDGRAAPYNVTFTATNALSGSASTAITVSDVSPADHAPVVTAPSAATVSEGAQVTVNVTAADPDAGQAITSLTADLSALPAGSNAVFTPNGSNTAGTLTWTPTSNDGRAAPYNVTFTATNALSGSASTAITVNDVSGGGGTNLVSNPGFETDLSGWAKNGTATPTRVSGGHSGSWSCQVTTTSSSTFGITDNPGIVPNVAAAGITYHLTAWVRSASNTGAAKLKLREFVGSTQQGSSTYSNPVTLSPAWQQVTLDYVTRTAGSFLDIEVNDYPVATGETFQIDDISVVQVSPAPAPPVAARPAGDAPPAAASASGPVARFAATFAPQPARGALALTLALGRAGEVRVRLYDLAGRLRAEPVHGEFAAGRHRIPVTGAVRGLPSGAYFYRIDAPEGILRGRIVVAE